MFKFFDYLRAKLNYNGLTVLDKMQTDIWTIKAAILSPELNIRDIQEMAGSEIRPAQSK